MASERSPSSLWHDALKTLSLEDQRQLKISDSKYPDILDSKDAGKAVLKDADKTVLKYPDIVDDVLKQVESKKTECMKKRWKFKRQNGDELILRDVFEKMVGWVQKFKEVGDIAVSFDPVHAALPWAGVRFLLQVVTQDVQTIGTMSDNLENISRLIARYKIFEKIYLDPSSKPDEQYNTSFYEILLEQLRSALVALYAVILLYLVKAKRYYSKNTALRMLKSAVQTESTSVDSYIAKVTASEIEVDKVAKLLTQHHSDIQRQTLNHMLDAFEKPIMRMADQLTNLHDDLQRKTRTAIFRWLSKVQYRRHHSSTQKDLLPHSGAWLLQNPEFIEWRNSSSSSVFWLHGIPGAGKTRLVSTFVETLQRENSEYIDSIRHEDGKPRRPAPIAYFYCYRDPGDKSRTDPEEIFRALLKQICCSDAESPIVPPLVEEYQLREDSGEEDITLTTAESVSIILKFLEKDPVTIVIDALDECEPKEYRELTQALSEIVQKSASLVKIFLSSRNDQDARFRSLGFPCLKISENENGSDIQRYIEWRLDEVIRNGDLISGQEVSYDLRKEIEATLIKKSHGMFLWASLQIENLCDSDRVNHEDDIRAELGRIPETLKEIYRLLLNRMKKAAVMSRTVADMTIKWLLCGCRNLSRAEFIAAVSIDFVTPRALSSAEHIKQACRNLVVEDKELDVFRFAHLSVREFFEEQAEYNLQETNFVVAAACLDALSIGYDLSGHSLDCSQPRDLTSYADIYWVVHYQRLRADSRYALLGPRVRIFLGTPTTVSPNFVEWVERIRTLDLSYLPDPSKENQGRRPRDISAFTGHYDFGEGHIGRYSLRDSLEEIPSTPPTTLFLLSVFGFIEVLQDINKDRTLNLDVSNERGNFALHLAVHGLHQSTVEFLLSCGAYPDPIGGMGWSPLFWAVEYGEVEMSTRILEFGGSPNRKDTQGLTPLLRVTRNKDEGFVNLLLQHGADPDFCRDREGWTPLRWATNSGRVDITKLLLDKDAKIESRDRIGLTPLLAASRDHLDKIVSLLIERRADPNIRDWDDWTPLARAAESGDEIIVKLLLSKGAEADPQDAYGRTPLRWAATAGHQEIASLLLRNGADPRRKDRDGWTVTELANICENDAIVKELSAREHELDSKE